MTLDFTVEKNTGSSIESSDVKWEVFTDSLNQSYIYCAKTQSFAYFVNNETLHYFTDFKGDTNSLLYYFYLAAHKILMGYFQDLEVKDILPLNGFFGGISKTVQDFIAPFKIYQKVEYVSIFKEIDDLLQPQNIKITSNATAKSGNKVKRSLDFNIELKDDKIASFTIQDQQICITAKRLA